MARLKITNINKVKTDIRKAIRKASRNPIVRKGIGEIVVDQIRKEPVPVKSKVTLAWRKYLEIANPQHPDYKRENINITFTGELLDDLANNVKADFKGQRTSYVIQHTDKKHRKYKKPNGKPLRGKRQSYKTISEFVIAKGYKYLNFSKENKKRVLEFFTTTVFDLIKRGN